MNEHRLFAIKVKAALLVLLVADLLAIHYAGWPT